MKVYRPTYRDRKNPEAERKTCKKYRCEFTDNLGIRRRLTLFSNRTDSERAADRIEEILSKTGSLPRDLQQWVDQLPTCIRNELVSFGVLDSLGADLGGLLDEWRRSLLAGGTKASQADLVFTRARTVFHACQFSRWFDITATGIEAYLKVQRDRDRGISQQTSNHYIRACKQFCRWMVDNRRASESPISHLKMMTVTDKVERRVLTTAERTALLRTTAAAEPLFGMSGHERSLLYRTALETGLRVRELWSLTVGDFDFSDRTVTVQASYTKSKRKDVLPLRVDTAEVLRQFMGLRLRHLKAFNVPAPGKNEKFCKVTTMFHADREAAKIAYKIQGQKIDFHSLRHTFITSVVQSGATVKEAQTLARHSRAALTLDVYTHVGLNDTRRVIDRLETVEAAAVKTGTNDASPVEDKKFHCTQLCKTGGISWENHRTDMDNGPGRGNMQDGPLAAENPHFSGTTPDNCERARQAAVGAGSTANGLANRFS